MSALSGQSAVTFTVVVSGLRVEEGDAVRLCGDCLALGDFRESHAGMPPLLPPPLRPA